MKNNINRTYKAESIDYEEQVIIRAIGWEVDPTFGFKLADGQDFIGEKDFITLDQQIQEIKLSKKKIILSLGDSSTSGWDPNVFLDNVPKVQEGMPTEPTFFQYKTYSDMLRDKIGAKFTVINAGIPGYTSFQGAIRLKKLLNIFKRHEIKIHYVLSYFGNNDSHWWRVGEDKDWVGIKDSKERLTEISHKLKSVSNQIITRVSPEDFKKNLFNISKICRLENIVPIFIEPVTSIYWMPGQIHKHRFADMRILNETVLETLTSAIHMWEVAIKESTFSNAKQLLLEEAREKDFALARIKKTHIKVLNKFVSEFKVPYVSIDLDRTVDDSQYFIDSNHPINDANKFLAIGIKDVISEFESGNRKDFKTLAKFPQLVIKKPTSKSLKPEDYLPLTQYPLY